jgi:anti-sigma regulatory factor (Ser/Thr protein kinase)
MNTDEPFRDSEIYQSPLTKDFSSVALARLTLRAFLWDWHLDYLADTAQLIISELATNSLKFGTGTGLTSIYLRDDGPDQGSLVMEVTDDSPEMPVLSQAGPSDECHRGLVLVDGLASKWGVELLSGQKVVWATLEYDDRTAQGNPLTRNLPLDGVVWQARGAHLVRLVRRDHHGRSYR